MRVDPQAMRQAAIPVKDHVRQTFLRSYPPYQYKLISELFKLDEKPLSTGKEWILPKWDGGKPPRLLIIAGIGSIEFILKLTRDAQVKKYTRAFVFIENRSEVIASLLGDIRFLQFLINPNFKFIFKYDQTNFMPALFNTLKQPQFSSLMQCVQTFVNEEEVDEDIKKFYKTLPHLIEETIFHVFHNYGRIDDSLLGVEAAFLNKDYILNNPGIIPLKGLYKNLPALIVAAGPSLDYNIDLIAKNKDKFIIFCADAAVKPLLKAGITPDYCTSIERGNLYQRPFWEDLPQIETELVFFPVVHPEVLSIYPGPKRVVYRNYSYFAYFEHSFPKGILACGGSTTHLAFRLAVYTGCKDFIFVGLDNAYESRAEDDLVRSHCNNLGHKDWAEWKDIKRFEAENKHSPFFLTKAVDGSNVFTNVTYNQWAKEFSEDIANIGLSDRCYITNPKAVAMPGATYTPLESLCNSLDPIVKPSKPKDETTQYRQWDNQGLCKNIKDWIDVARKTKDLIARSKALAPDRDIISFIYQIVRDKLTFDNMFISFVIQNAAVEFYKNENCWNKLENDIMDDYEDRLRVLDERLNIYLEVLEKLNGIMERVEKP